MFSQYTIAADISQAATLPGKFYVDSEVFEKSKSLIFSRSWQFVGEQNLVRLANQVYPFSLLEGYLDEPLVLTKTELEEIFCLSNVCTHRGNLVVNNAGQVKQLQCRYHGKRFGLDGCFKAMPEFKTAKNFPTEADNLPKLPLQQWGNMLFTSINPLQPFSAFFGEMQTRLNWLKINELIYQPQLSRDYLVKANWMLYCDNYLEGFHIPFVHESLNNLLDYGSYASELYPLSNLQLGIARPGEACFDLPPDSPDYGKAVAAYYYWIFPNLMFNFYPWGLSMNVVKPISQNLTKVSFLTFSYNSNPMQDFIASNLDKVEREDEEVVECVQKGVKSHFYQAGRYSPAMEQGVHHFHQLLLQFLQNQNS
jgi:choline monooxygenase